MLQMKKKFILATLFILSSILSFSQHIIPKFGGTLTSVSYNNNGGVQNSFGFLGGVALELPLKGSFLIQPELLFHRKGYKYHGTMLYGVDNGYELMPYNEKFNLNYIELPVLVKFNIKKFYFNFGPYFAYGIGGNYKYDDTRPVSYSGKVKFKKTSGYIISHDGDAIFFDNAFDYGLQIGGGVKIGKRIIIDLRYGYGLKNIYDKDPSINYIKNKSQNRSLQLSLGYPIKF